MTEKQACIVAALSRLHDVIRDNYSTPENALDLMPDKDLVGTLNVLYDSAYRNGQRAGS